MTAAERWRRQLAGLAGWRRAGAAILLGILLTVALPPIYLLPAALVALAGLAWMIDGNAGWRGAFATGWWFGVGHFATGLYWIGNSLLVDAARHGWMYPPALVAIAAGFALFTGLAAALARPFPVGAPRLVAFVLAWVAVEWLRGWLFTGFPWNLAGTALALDPAPMQAAALGGVLGLSVIVAGAAALLALAGHDGARRSRLGRWRGPLLAVLLVAAAWAGGALRLAGADAAAPGPVLRLVQANIGQAEKNDPGLRDSHFATHFRQSLSQTATIPTVVIWPEVAIPYLVTPETAPRIGSALRPAIPAGGYLISGALRAAPDGAGGHDVWNSLVVFDDAGRLAATYDKHHLVPFGEYVPLSGLLPMQRLTPGLADFSAGPGPRTLALPGLAPFSPLICYEAIFPGEAVDPDARPAWLVNITNDGWFGVSSGPHQHLASARLRAVEQGLPLVRAANTGISAVTDGYGRIVASLALDSAGVIDVALPADLGPTPYARWGDAVLLPILLAGLAFLARSLLRGNNSDS